MWPRQPRFDSWCGQIEAYIPPLHFRSAHCFMPCEVTRPLDMVREKPAFHQSTCAPHIASCHVKVPHSSASGLASTAHAEPSFHNYPAIFRHPSRPHRLVVRTSRCGRDNPRSTPGAVREKPTFHHYTCAPHIASWHMKAPHTSASGSASTAHAEHSFHTILHFFGALPDRIV